MFDIGFSELLLFGVIALIVLGPEKLPQAARTAGQWYAKIRRTVSTLQSEIEAELDLAETRQLMQKELAKIRQTEADMRREMAEMRGSMQEFESSQNQNLKSPNSVQNNPEPNDGLTNDETEPKKNEPVAFNYAFEQNIPEAALSASALNNDKITTDTPSSTASINPVNLVNATRPWENMWFRLGDYDKARRLPAAPYLPNYKADILLNAYSNSDLDGRASMNNQEAE